MDLFENRKLDSNKNEGQKKQKKYVMQFFGMATIQEIKSKKIKNPFQHIYFLLQSVPSVRFRNDFRLKNI